jgi:hypothetical protein
VIVAALGEHEGFVGVVAKQHEPRQKVPTWITAFYAKESVSSWSRLESV